MRRRVVRRSGRYRWPRKLLYGQPVRDNVRGFWTYEDLLVTNVHGETCNPRTGKVEWIDQGDWSGETIVRNPTG